MKNLVPRLKQILEEGQSLKKFGEVLHEGWKLKKQMAKMQKDMNKMFETTQEELNKQVETSKASIQSSAQRLLTLKQEKGTQGKIAPVDVEVNPDDSDESVENWEITFDED